jgi:hypothetical protein
MKRDYTTGVKDDIVFFTGTEVEHTPAFGIKTLFVVGHHSYDDINSRAVSSGCKHIYLGANQSFDPGNYLDDSSISDAWDAMIKSLLDNNWLTTLDFDVKHIEWVLEGCYCEYDNFIPQVSVKLPYIKQLNYNAMVKIDDKNFKASNPGVWCHRIHNLMDVKVFTPWNEYTNDAPI